MLSNLLVIPFSLLVLSDRIY